MNRRLPLFIPPLVLDRASSIPLHRQIHDQLTQAIRGGALDRDSRLPSTRALARFLRVSRNTVVTAYDALVANGQVQGRRGSGMLCVAPLRVPFNPALILRAAQYPARVLTLSDPDGNPLSVNF